MTPPTHARAQTTGEELANALSHGLGCLLAIASLPILVWEANRQGNTLNVVAAAVFAGTMILPYAVSTLYHALCLRVGAKVWMHREPDHAAIYLFIAGSYTPFTLGVLKDGWGWVMFAVVWTAAAFGVTVKLLNRPRTPGWSRPACTWPRAGWRCWARVR